MAPTAAPERSTEADPTFGQRRGRLLVAILAAGVAVRVLAALVLVVGPWTDSAVELAGWDVGRFQEIADADGRHWVDHEVEYPPGSVVVIEALAQGSVVETHRVLAAFALAVDLGVALLLGIAAGRRAAVAYLVLGLPLVPAGLVRLDVLSIGLAVAAAIALVGLSRRPEGSPEGVGGPSRPVSFAAIVTAASLVKVWPGLLVAGAIALGRRAAAITALAVMAISGVAWLLYGGQSLEPIDQVLSLRGASGWHVESLGGTITSLASDAEAQRQLDAFRIGELNPALVTAGRAVTVAVVVGLGWLAHRRTARTAQLEASRATSAADELYTLSLFILGATAALLVTAPLLSPQFLLWLTPWAAVVAARGGRWSNPTVLLTGAATALTGAVLAVFGPPNLAATAPAALLLARNLLLVAVIAAAALELRPTAPAVQAERNAR